MVKQWYLSKTIWVNALAIAGAVLLLATTELDLSAGAMQWVMFAYGVVNIGLRTITKEGIALK